MTHSDINSNSDCNNDDNNPNMTDNILFREHQDLNQNCLEYWT